MGSAGTQHCPHGDGTVPTLSGGRQGPSKPSVTTLKCFTSNTNTNSQPEAEKFNYQGQLDLGKGLTLRVWRREHCKLSGAEEMDSGQGLFMCLKVSQALFCQAWPATQPKPGLQDIPWGQPGLTSRDLLCHPRGFGREPCPAIWGTHISGSHVAVGQEDTDTWAHTLAQGWLLLLHHCWSLPQPRTRQQRGAGDRIYIFCQQ